MFKINLK